MSVNRVRYFFLIFIYFLLMVELIYAQIDNTSGKFFNDIKFVRFEVTQMYEDVKSVNITYEEYTSKLLSYCGVKFDDDNFDAILRVRVSGKALSKEYSVLGKTELLYTGAKISGKINFVTVDDREISESFLAIVRPPEYLKIAYGTPRPKTPELAPFEFAAQKAYLPSICTLIIKVYGPDVLVSALKDSEESLRIASALSLGMFGDSRAIHQLTLTLAHKDFDVSNKAEKLLNEIDKNWRETDETKKAVLKMISNLEIADWDTVYNTIEALEKIDKSWKRSQNAKNMIPHFLKALNSQNFNKIDCASYVLEFIADDSAIEPLVIFLNGKGFYVHRARAAEALGNIGDKRATLALIEALKDEDLGHTRATVAEALGRIGDQRALKPLNDLLNDQDKYVRKAAEEAIMQISSKS